VSSAAPGLDGLLDQLETVIGRLTDPGAPLERLVADYEEAGRLVEAADAQLAAATARLAAREPGPGAPEAPARD
jgi:exodeoxyribonuclease VII small subunit